MVGGQVNPIKKIIIDNNNDNNNDNDNNYYYCVRGTQPLISVGVLCIIECPVQLIKEVFLRLHLCRHTFASL